MYMYTTFQHVIILYMYTTFQHVIILYMYTTFQHVIILYMYTPFQHVIILCIQLNNYKHGVKQQLLTKSLCMTSEPRVHLQTLSLMSSKSN
jgi:hypothetical protein